VLEILTAYMGLGLAQENNNPARLSATKNLRDLYLSASEFLQKTPSV